MDPVNLATILVALIAAAGAWASQRAAARASTQNTVVGGRVDMEKEAYDRARTYDTETIRRQDAEIDELRSQHAVCAAAIEDIKKNHEIELQTLRQRIARLEKGLHHNLEDLLHERLREFPEDPSLQQ